MLAGRCYSYSVGQIVSKEFMDVVSVEDLVGLANYSIYLKLMIDGMPSRPFKATTLVGSGPCATAHVAYQVRFT